MQDIVIDITPGEERVIRVRCAGGGNQPAPPGPAEDAAAPVNQEEPAAAQEPAGLPNIEPPLQQNIVEDIRNNMAQRKSRKNRKNNGATRKNGKQSGGKRLNPFMSFAAKERKNIMSANPGMPVTEVGKELGKRWRALSEAERKKY